MKLPDYKGSTNYKEVDDEKDNDFIHELACDLIICGVLFVGVFFLTMYLRG